VGGGKLRIAFLGTPDFAVPSLRMLVAAGHDVAGVFTQPDRPRDRGLAESPSSVKLAALELGLRVNEFVRIRRPEGVAAMEQLAPDVMVTAAFGQILSQKLLDIPKYGCVNVHASLLPKYRGPAPIQWAVIRGETETGITTMLTDAGIDTGDILLQRKTDIAPDETAGELFARLAALGAETLIETLRLMESGKLRRAPQDHAAATHFPMLTKEDGRVDWSKKPKEICDLVRGVNPWPGAWTSCRNETLKIWKAEPAPFCGEPGVVLKANHRDGFVVGALDGSVRILDVQMQGKKRMNCAQYLCGCRLEEGKALDAG
jgi:methionyl-tRNA formyltransferase